MVVMLVPRHVSAAWADEDDECPTSSGNEFFDFLVDTGFQVGWKD